MSLTARMFSRSVTAALRISAVRRMPRLGGLVNTGRFSALYNTRITTRRGLATSSAEPSADPQLSEKESKNDPESSAKESTNHAVVSTFDLFSIGVGPSSR
ncbi:hypothetical protein GGH97_002413 [Coemansia sp. RSA 475]|nr:hypothetical protein GGH97_002413 [Coemansia sp. RSA 475]